MRIVLVADEDICLRHHALRDVAVQIQGHGQWFFRADEAAHGRGHIPLGIVLVLRGHGAVVRQDHAIHLPGLLQTGQ